MAARRWPLVFCSFLAVALSGCTSARDTLGTNASPCFEALAVGEDAVHARGTFAGVHLISLTSFGKDARHGVRSVGARRIEGA